MKLTIGSKVIYPAQGPCLIGPIVRKEVAGQPVKFYQLSLLNENGGELFVPVEKAQTIGLRLLLKRSEIPRLLRQLKQTVSSAKDWKERAKENALRLASGSAFDLAEIVESLTARSTTKELSFPERRLLEKARTLLVGEIAEVMQETRSAAEQQIDRALCPRPQ
jgi:RNA polymerase-interacting CarD/CdnL/TRCF family regulator